MGKKSGNRRIPSKSAPVNAASPAVPPSTSANAWKDPERLQVMDNLNGGTLNLQPGLISRFFDRELRAFIRDNNESGNE